MTPASTTPGRPSHRPPALGRLPAWARSASVLVPASLVLALLLLATLALVVRGEVEQSEARQRGAGTSLAASPGIDRVADRRLDPR